MSKNMEIILDKKFIDYFDIAPKWREIDFIILHHIEAKSANHAIEMLKTYQVSSHFLIDEEGAIFNLVDENNIAYHAGVSFWNGCESLNKNSIGIEFVNKNVLKQPFNKIQLQSGVILCKYLMSKYNIAAKNIIGHSDIAYDKTSNLLNRKQDPSHLFDWQFFAQNGVGIFTKNEVNKLNDQKLFILGDSNQEIKNIKNKLNKIGYRLLNFDDNFDLEMQALAIVFNRHFCNQEQDFWAVNSDDALNAIIR